MSGLAAVPREVLALALALALAAALVQALARRLAAAARSRRARVRAARAGRGEREAAGFLEAAGYQVSAAQVSASYEVEVDGARVEVPLRVDYLVEKDGRRYVAEVKTGEVAPRIGTAATRRQLLEYLVAFEVDGVLLVDAERGAVHDVRFRGGGDEEGASATDAPGGRARALALVLVGVSIGVALGAVAFAAWGPDQAAAAGASSTAGAGLPAMPASTQRRATSSATGLTSATSP